MKSQYFVAILPSKTIEEKIDEIKKEFSDVYKSFEALKSPVHLTLKEPFTLEPKYEALLLRKLEGLSRIHQPFEQELKDFNRIQKHTVYIKVDKCAEINSLKKNMKRIFKETFFNAHQDQMPFNPHYTIACKDIPEKTFDLAWGDYQQKTFDASFTCNHFSLLKHTGIKWVIVRDFKLKGLPQQTLFDDVNMFNAKEKTENMVLKY